MGAISSLTKVYSLNEYLLWHIERNQIENIEQILKREPSLVDKNLSVNYKTTPLHRASCLGSFEVVKLLVEKYQASLDLKTLTGETPLMGAVKRNQLVVAKYLIQKGANPTEISKCGLSVIDYAILQGLYQMALLITQNSPADLDIKSPLEYQSLAERFKYRYVNYDIFISNLNRKISPDSTRQFLKKAKVTYNDPVIDPRQSWKNWILRNLEFRDPPLVQRTELPEYLQPQNRKLAKLNHFFTKISISPLAQTPSLQPVKIDQLVSNDKMNINKNWQSGNIEILTV